MGTSKIVRAPDGSWIFEWARPTPPRTEPKTDVAGHVIDGP